MICINYSPLDIDPSPVKEMWAYSSSTCTMTYDELRGNTSTATSTSDPALLEAIYRYGDLMVLGFALVLFAVVSFMAFRLSRKLL